jgi:hypothetical protein
VAQKAPVATITTIKMTQTVTTACLGFRFDGAAAASSCLTPGSGISNRETGVLPEYPLQSVMLKNSAVCLLV